MRMDGVRPDAARRTPRVRVTVRLGPGEPGSAPWEAPSGYGAMEKQEEPRGRRGGGKSLIVEGASGEVHELKFSQVSPQRSSCAGAAAIVLRSLLDACARARRV